jgi:hypothetical protein
VLNGLNDFFDRTVARGLPPILGGFAEKGSIRLATLFLVPLKALTGVDRNTLKEFKHRVDASLSTATSPIGSSAAVVTVFLILFIWMILR